MKYADKYITTTFLTKTYILPPMKISGPEIQRIQKKILSYYKKNGRDLPWRKTTDRYAILVSEIMLQQTQVDRVVPKYEAWLREFPTSEALAQAPLKKVLEMWSGLGYNNRAKRLQDCAKIAAEQYNGEFPSQPDELQKFPGIGPYTSRSVPIFADNADVATVDTNIRRILIHELQLDESISEDDLYEIAAELVPIGKSRDWHNALMDYGAMELTSKRSGIRPTSRQAKFKGSKRWYRGDLLKHLLKKPLTLKDAKQLYPDCQHDVSLILRDLEKDGLITKNNKLYTIK